MKGRAGGGGTRRRRGSRGGGLAGDAQTGAPGVNPTRAWVREVQGGMRNPPVQFVWDFEVRDGSRSGRAGSARQRFAGASVLGAASARVGAKLGQCACVTHG